MAHGKDLFKNIIECPYSKEELVTKLMQLLSEDTKFENDQELKRRVGNNPIWPQYSSIYVNIPEINYGSRIKTVILLDDNDCLDFYEESIQPDGTWKTVHIQRKL